MKRTIYLVLFALIAVLALTACGGESLECTDPLGCVEVGPDEPILLASSLVISGPNTELGLDSQYGVEIALDFRGEVLGHALELQPEDDGCNAEGGQTSAQKIVSNPQVVAMIGTSCSGAGVPASKIISDAGYAMVSPSNTAPALTDPELHEAGYLRTAHNDKVQGRAMAEYAINELGVTKAAAIHDGDPYTEGLASVFSEAFQELGGEIVAFEAIDAQADDVIAPLTTIAAAGPPEMIYYPVFIPLGSLITKQAQEVDGLQGVILAAADGVQSPSFLEAAGDAAEGMYVSGPDLGFGNETYDSFLAAYQEKYGTEPTAPFHAHAFDATNMVLDAIEEVAQVGDDGTLLIGRQALRDALFATSGMTGITGTITCDEYGDCADPKIAVSQVQGADFVPVWP
jgi:branched-chain amino acid transport system substrate-binding protein